MLHGIVYSKESLIQALDARVIGIFASLKAIKMDPSLLTMIPKISVITMFSLHVQRIVKMNLITYVEREINHFLNELLLKDLIIF